MTVANDEYGKPDEMLEPIAVPAGDPTVDEWVAAKSAITEPFPSRPEEIGAENEARASLSLGAVIFGALLTLGFIGFVLLAKVTVHPSDGIDRRMRVIDVWRRLRNHLPEVAHPTLLRTAFDISMILIVAGSFACIWLALLATASNVPQFSGDEDRTAGPTPRSSEH
jgi:hypothetical protein